MCKVTKPRIIDPISLCFVFVFSRTCHVVLFHCSSNKSGNSLLFASTLKSSNQASVSIIYKKYIQTVPSSSSCLLLNTHYLSLSLKAFLQVIYIYTVYLFVSGDARFGAVCMLLLDNGACQLVTFFGFIWQNIYSLQRIRYVFFFCLNMPLESNSSLV